jgi:hypothetical protein
LARGDPVEKEGAHAEQARKPHHVNNGGVPVRIFIMKMRGEEELRDRPGNVHGNSWFFGGPPAAWVALGGGKIRPRNASFKDTPVRPETHRG